MTIKTQGNSAKRRKVVQKHSNRPRASSSSSSDTDSNDDKAAMLAALEAHSRAMFGMDGPDEAESSTKAAERASSSSGDESEDDEGTGEEYDSDDGWGEGDEMVSDSEEEGLARSKPKATQTSSSAVPEVVFAETGRKSASAPISNTERRAFLKGTSAKMMGITTTPDFIPKRQQRALGAVTDKSDGEEEDDSSNLKLDKTLHNMLLTTLLPSSDAMNAQRPVDKRKAINGRLLELASYHLPGEGSKSINESELSSHSAKIRTGIMHAKSHRDKKVQEEAEASGSFVRGLGGLGGEGRGFKREKGRGERGALGEDVGKKKGMGSRKDMKRERGLGSGFGKFEGGMLKLSESDIARGSAPQGGGRGRGHGGGKKRRR